MTTILIKICQRIYEIESSLCEEGYDARWYANQQHENDFYASQGM